MKPEIEEKLIRMKKLSLKIKELSAELNMIKQDVINHYFLSDKQEEYKTEKGLVLATYKSYEKLAFNDKRFKTDFPDIYENYKEKKSVTTFLLK